METLTEHDSSIVNAIELGRQELPISYTKHIETQHIRYTGGDSVVINTGEASSDAKSFGTFEMGGISVPVVAELNDSSPRSKYLIVDIRSLGMPDFYPTSVEGFKKSVDMAHHLGKYDESRYAAQYALISLAAIRHQDKDDGSMFSVSVISRSTAATIGDDVSITTNEEGKLAVSMALNVEAPIEVSAAEGLTYEAAQPIAGEVITGKGHMLRKRKMLGRSAMEGAHPNAFTGYSRSHGYNSHPWNDPGNRFMDDAYKPDFKTATNAADLSRQPVDRPLINLSDINTPELALSYMEQQNKLGKSPKDTKRELLKEFYPRNGEGSVGITQAITSQFSPVRHGEYRDYGAGASGPQAEPESVPAPESNPAPEPTAAQAPATEPMTTTSVVVPAVIATPVALPTSPPVAE